jgi:hypothetical protein
MHIGYLQTQTVTVDLQATVRWNSSHERSKWP